MNGNELDKAAPWVVLVGILVVVTWPIWYPIDTYRRWRSRKSRIVRHIELAEETERRPTAAWTQAHLADELAHALALNNEREALASLYEANAAKADKGAAHGEKTGNRWLQDASRTEAKLWRHAADMARDRVEPVPSVPLAVRHVDDQTGTP